MWKPKKRDDRFSYYLTLLGYSRASISISNVPLDVLTLWLDFVAQNQVSGESEDQEENPQHHEVHVKLCVLHIQQLQDLLWLLKLTHRLWTFELRPVHPINREYHPLKAIPKSGWLKRVSVDSQTTQTIDYNEFRKTLIFLFNSLRN